MRFVAGLANELAHGEVRLPSFPEAVERIRRVVSDPRADAGDVAEAVQTDPAFAAKLFQIANSVMLRRGDVPLSDLRAVVNRLGFGMVQNLATALATRQMLQSRLFEGCAGAVRDVWAHCVETAAIASVIARGSGVSPHEALLAGLLHDIGLLYIHARLANEPGLEIEPETRRWILRDWHPTVARAILEHWEFPDDIITAVDEHETLDRQHSGPPDLADVICAANLLAQGDDEMAEPVDLDRVGAISALRRCGVEALDTLLDCRAEIDALEDSLT